MENTTIYPFGTDGELPSNIGIINDLVTGGADKALSAQQGVELKKLIEDGNKMPYAFETRFSVFCEVAHTQQTNWNTIPISTINSRHIYEDNAVLYLPDNYKQSGTPTKLIIFCKQGSSKIGANAANDWEQKIKGRSPILSLPFMPYLLSIGYAILGVDGEPDAWLEAIGLGDNIESSSFSDNIADLSAYGNYVAVESTRRAYDYVIEHFNLDPNGCFIFGYSQGGLLMQNVIDLSGIPILAAAGFSPSCSIHWHQWNNSSSATDIGNVPGVTYKARLIISRMFGFGADIINNDQLVAMLWDTVKDKLAGYDPYTRNSLNEFTHYSEANSGLHSFESGYGVNNVNMIKEMKCPFKVWCADNDTRLGQDVTKAFVKAIKNGGGVADIVIYSSGGHSFFSSQSNAGSCVVNGTTYNYKPVAVELATWYHSFGGYNQEHQEDGRLEYIETDGSAYIISGFQGKTPRSVKLKCIIPQLLTDNMTIVGGETSDSITDNKRYVPVRINGNNYASLGYQNYYDCIDISQAISQGKTIEIYGRMKDGEQEMGVKVEGEENYTTHSETNSYNISSGKNMYIFACNRDGTAVSNCIQGTRLYYCQLCSNYEGTTVYRNLVPWRLNGRVGLMDTNSNTFFGNNGSGAFIAGPNV